MADSTHTVFPPGRTSPCPWHRGWCAYTGTEPDRCPCCHRLYRLIDREPGGLGRHRQGEASREANRLGLPGGTTWEQVEKYILAHGRHVQRADDAT